MPRLLFVCTGNTCRSALAEGIARARLGPDSPVEVASAGLEALDGAPAAPAAVEVAAEIGVDLSRHRARPATRALLAGVDRVYAMTGRQAEGLARLGVPEDRVALLDPEGEEIADPHGGDLAAYRRARDRLAAAVAARLEEWAGSS